MSILFIVLLVCLVVIMLIWLMILLGSIQGNDRWMAWSACVLIIGLLAIISGGERLWR